MLENPLSPEATRAPVFKATMVLRHSMPLQPEEAPCVTRSALSDTRLVCINPGVISLARSSAKGGAISSRQPWLSVPLIVSRAKKPGLLVALDGIQDPHNVGAILRTCDCTGVDGVILTKHNSCGLTPTVVKASTGAAYTVPVSIVTNLSQTLRNLKQEGYWVVGTDMKDAREYREGMYDSPTVLVIGSEGQGISNLVKKQCDYMVYLPMVGSITSLNASVAAAVLMYEVYNQRNPIK